MRYNYVTVDVFTDRPFGGNPLAVITDASGLTEAEMQSIATEFHYAETTFVLPPNDPAHTARVRIFTPKYEVPFAGHPNVGTAFVLARRGAAFGKPIGACLLLEEEAGLVPVDILARDGVSCGARLTAPQPLSLGREVSAAIVAACVGLDAVDIVLDHHVPVVASVGLPFVLAEVRDIEALGRCRPSFERFAEHLPIDGADAIHLYVRESRQPNLAVRARMFSLLDGVGEDAATGSANAALAALLAEHAPQLDSEMTMRAVQGVEMGRPSLLEATVTKIGGKIVSVRIGGSCVPIMEGSLSTHGI